MKFEGWEFNRFEQIHGVLWLHSAWHPIQQRRVYCGAFFRPGESEWPEALLRQRALLQFEVMEDERIREAE